MKENILVVDEDREMCDVIATTLKRGGFEPVLYTSAENAFHSMKEIDYTVVITALRMSHINGLELCDRIVSNYHDIPVIVITAYGNMDTAVAAMRAGAYDFVTKPVDMKVLKLTVERAITHHKLVDRVKKLTQSVSNPTHFSRLLGSSPVMKSLFDQIDQMSKTDLPVLVTGESGTGKELVARALHQNSTRCKGPFVAVNCAAMPDSLIESELFGHVKGAYTGAVSDHNGMFLEANKGTLVLDEIGELPVALQPKLLRALEEQTVRPLGADKELKFDARVMAATNRDLGLAVEDGRFREDLFYRINVVQIDVPPLRARGMDVLHLAQHFIVQAASQANKQVIGISETAAEKLLAYRWPGNVRELRNAIARAVACKRAFQNDNDWAPCRLKARI